jgi:hypothetical protein
VSISTMQKMLALTIDSREKVLSICVTSAWWTLIKHEARLDRKSVVD